MQYRKKCFSNSQWSSPARQALISNEDAKSRCMIHPQEGFEFPGAGGGGAAPRLQTHEVLELQHVDLWNLRKQGPETQREIFARTILAMKPSDQAPKEQALLFSKLYKLQANWRPQDTPIRSSAASDRGTKQQQKEELNADVFLAFGSLVIYRSLIVPGRWILTTACELPLTLYTIMHLPSWTLSYGGKQLCLWHSWIPSMYGKDSEVCCFFLDWERAWETSSEFKGYQPKDEPQVKKLVTGGSVE